MVKTKNIKATKKKNKIKFNLSLSINSCNLNSLPLHHGIRIYLQKTADSGNESDAEIYI